MDGIPKGSAKPKADTTKSEPQRNFLFKFARNLGRTARLIKFGSTWLFRRSGQAIPKAAMKVGEGLRTLDHQRKHLLHREAVPAASKEAFEKAAVADVEAAMRAAEEASDEATNETAEGEIGETAEEEAIPDVEAVMKAAEAADEEDSEDENEEAAVADVEAAMKAVEEEGEEE